MGRKNKELVVDNSDKDKKRTKKSWRRNRELDKRHRGILLKVLQHISSPQKKAFLYAYMEQGGIRSAGEAAGMEWRNHYNWMKSDEDYKEAFHTAKELFTDFMEEEIVRRGFKGVDKPIILPREEEKSHVQGVQR